ncbi:MAG: hypothetical protein ACI9MU_003419, partial [Alphaproteobacteria bacterium]
HRKPLPPICAAKPKEAADPFDRRPVLVRP